MRTLYRLAPLLLVAVRPLAAQPPVAPVPPLPPDLAPARVAVFRTRTVAPRSALGLYIGDADTLGLRVERVTTDGPAAKGGIAAGDRLLSVNGTSLRVDRGDVDDALLAAVPARRLERTVGRLTPGSEVELRVAGRDGRERTIRVRTVAPTALADAAGAWRDGFAPNVFLSTRRAPFGSAFGITGRGMNDSLVAAVRRRAAVATDSARARAAARPALGLTLAPSNSARDTLGLFVSGVVTGGPADRAGVVEGDRVAALNGVDLRVSRDEQGDDASSWARRSRFTRELERARAGDRVTLKVWGDGRWRTVTATVARAGDLYPNGSAPGSGFRFEFGPAWGARAADR